MAESQGEMTVLVVDGVVSILSETEFYMNCFVVSTNNQVPATLMIVTDIFRYPVATIN